MAPTPDIPLAALSATAFEAALLQRGYSSTTVTTYGRIAARWLASGREPAPWLRELQDDSRQAGVLGGGLPSTNAANAGKALRLYLRLDAETRGVPAPAALQTVRPPHTHRFKKHRRAPLSREEEARVRAVLAAAPAESGALPPVLAAAHLMLDLGLRLEETLQLELGDLRADPGGAVLTVREGKGRSQAAGDAPEHLGLPPALVAILAGYLRGWRAGRPGPYLFPSPRPGRAEAGRGAPWSDRGMRAAIGRLGELAGLPPAREGATGADAGLHPHRLRHTLATRLAEAGVPREDIRLVLRHREPGVTAGYVHPGPEHVRAVLARLQR